ncbi:MAG: hypothetical protein ACRC6T_01815 [Sarcina sp.]
MKKIEKISTHLKMLLFFSLIALGLCICMWYVAVLFDFIDMYSTKKIYNQGNYNMAKVVDYKITSGKGGTHYYPIIKYQVGTEIYEDYKIKFDGYHLMIGEEVLIYTDTKNPQKFMIARAEYYDSIEMFWEYILILLIGIIMIIAPFKIEGFIEKRETVKKESTKKKKKLR